MQLRLALSVPKFTGSLFKQSTSAILTGVTIAGAFATVIFNSRSTRGKVTDAFQTFAKLLSDTPIYSGAEKLATTFKDWGTTLVSKKDDFVQWVDDYLNVSGFKSGAVELYNKLYDWAEIVYNWFKDKFIIFIKNIPKMVENWKSLRLSLFKWGTFLGGGGGSALWAMFGSGDNWGKLAELMGSPEFGEIAEKFGKLMEENSDAFASMDEEEVKEIFEAIMDDPKEAKGIVEELLKDQEEKNKEKAKINEDKPEEEKEPKEQLKKEEIIEKFKKSGGGSPKKPEEAFGHMTSLGLQKLSSLSASKAWDTNIAGVVEAEMNKYIQTLKDEVSKKGRKWEVKQQFLDAIKENEKGFVKALAEAAKEAYDLVSPMDYKSLAEKFGEVLERKFTVEATGEEGGESISIRDKIPTSPVGSK